MKNERRYSTWDISMSTFLKMKMSSKFKSWLKMVRLLIQCSSSKWMRKKRKRSKKTIKILKRNRLRLLTKLLIIIKVCLLNTEICWLVMNCLLFIFDTHVEKWTQSSTKTSSCLSFCSENAWMNMDGKRNRKIWKF